MYDLVTRGPAQPSRHSRPVAASISRVTTARVRFAGTVPRMNSSTTARRDPGVARAPVKGSIRAETRLFGRTRSKRDTGRRDETSDRIADHSGAEVSSDSLPSFGELSELPSHTPATRPGSERSAGGAR